MKADTGGDPSRTAWAYPPWPAQDDKLVNSTYVWHYKKMLRLLNTHCHSKPPLPRKRRAVSCRAQWVRSARKTVQWTVFSGERAAAQDDEGRRRTSEHWVIRRGSALETICELRIAKNMFCCSIVNQHKGI